MTAKPKSSALTKISQNKGITGPGVEVLGPDPFVDVQDKMKKLEKNDAVKTAKELLDSIGKSYFYFGGIMSKIQANGWFTEEGYESFQDFVTIEMGMKYRKAMYFIEIYNYLTVAQIPYEKVKNVGWTKLKEIACLLTEDNVDALVKKAEGMNTLQLIEEVKLLKAGEVKATDQKPKSNPISSKVFKLHDDQREIINEALAKAKEVANTEFEAVALENICFEYLNQSQVSTDKMPSLPQTSLMSMLQDKGTEKALLLMQEAFPKASISCTIE